MADNTTEKPKTGRGSALPGSPEQKAYAAERRKESIQERKKLRKTFKEVFNEILPYPALCLEEYAAWMLINYPNCSYEEAIALAMIKRATMGDVNAAIFVRDTVGESPKTVLQMEGADKEMNINITVDK